MRKHSHYFKEAGMAKETAMDAALNDDVFLAQFVGEGQENFTGETVSTAYLGLVQPDSTNESGECPRGTWRNSSTGRSYGNEVDVIPLAFRTVWSERESDEPYRTVARYQPNSIEVQVQQPPKGKRGYPKLINPDSGNEIQELYIYAVVLPQYPEDGVLYFSPTVGSMRTCKQWNAQLKSQVLSNGAQAPIFGGVWTLKADLVPNPKQPSRQMAKFVSATKKGVTSKELFTAQIQPVITEVKRSVLQIAQGELPEPVDDSE